MKLWQLFSMTRGRDNVIEEEAKKSQKWGKYILSPGDIDNIIANQDRKILDSTVDEDFSYAVLGNIDRHLYVSSGVLRSKRVHILDKKIHIKEAVRQFGANAVEDAFEYGSVSIAE